MLTKINHKYMKLLLIILGIFSNNLRILMFADFFEVVSQAMSMSLLIGAVAFGTWTVFGHL